MSEPTTKCPFCEPDERRVIRRFNHVFALWDGFPVSEGHALIVPCRHVSSWFDASAEERAALFGAIDAVCAEIDARLPADGFNFGINAGEAAGQTVPHLHLHVIPRRAGDVPDPRGGVRYVIPERANYLAAAARPPSVLRVSEPRVLETLLTTGDGNPLLTQLERDLSDARSLDVAVAFVMPSGVERLYPHFEDLLERGGALRLVTGDYLDVSDPDALQRLVDLRALYGAEKCQLRVFESKGKSFHPKAYVVSHVGGRGAAYVGSSNLSASALVDGIEWNYRVLSARDAEGWQQVSDAFEALFGHVATRELDESWLYDYRVRRRTPSHRQLDFDEQIELPPPPPEPNVIQEEALAALAKTRADGYGAGLVVMATGLGKTWLAAFDSADSEYRRILFVAHRQEILNQSVATFRRIRPNASIGLYMGSERAPEADILFASIQTLGRNEHLRRFDTRAFDYIVVDEFHHASAATYRRLIDHFEPLFLLGLTATPERTDGGDLLALCQENLVYRCLVPRGIEEGLLSPYRYFGVPDDVDYANIPWRSTRFDEEALTQAVATQRRAGNIFEQWRKLGGKRTLAFCVSQRHADFMRRYFSDQGIACAAVHAGPSADSRSVSLERLATGDLQVIFAVDMFNEGVDVPAIDTVMMLRPTESQIVWLQQFGRGLRKHEDKRLTVIDYIGNHRSFLLKARTLLELVGGGDRALSAALERVEAGTFELPPGCEVTYDLEALSIMRALLRIPADPADTLREYYIDFRERNGERPSASEAFHDGYLPRTARRAHGSWFGFVSTMGDLDGEERQALDIARPFLEALESTKMTRSFKMLVLLAMLNTDTLPGRGIRIDDLSAECIRLARRNPKLAADLGAGVDDASNTRILIERNPIAAWAGEGAVPGGAAFEYSASVFRYRQPIPDSARAGFQRLVRELAEWRLTEYLSRTDETPLQDAFTMKVSHSAGQPILFLPDRTKVAGIPEGWQSVSIDGRPYRANFVKIAVNVVRAADSDDNALPAILRGWFGHDAGRPGTNHTVVCEHAEGEWVMRPVTRRGDDQAEVFKRYSREQIPRLFGDQFSDARWNSGFVVITPENPRHVVLLVTLHKGDMASQFQYGDHFLAPDMFQWQSQNRTKQSGKHGTLIRDHATLGVAVHLFVRAEKKRSGGAAAPFVYCGPVTFVEWEGDAPITVRWRLPQPLPARLITEFSVASSGGSQEARRG
jgi:superfamily II DNA or RNA helicase/diadenosine tetraphosphate (Ap4A) HIT family hydrolase